MQMLNVGSHVSRYPYFITHFYYKRYVGVLEIEKRNKTSVYVVFTKQYYDVMPVAINYGSYGVPRHELLML